MCIVFTKVPWKMWLISQKSFDFCVKIMHNSLRALGEEDIVELVEKNDIEMIKIFSDKLKNYLKQYLYIGGMPEVVKTYVETKDFIEVRRKQEVLLESYEQDFSKHAPNAIVPRIRQLWNNIPTQLAKENKKFILGNIDKILK